MKLSYNSRIHKGKLSARSLRYIAADQLARRFPALQQRWQFPVDSQPIAAAASGDHAFPTVIARGHRQPELQRLFPKRKLPLQIVQHVYEINNATVTGQAGAIIKDGQLLAVRDHPNWVSSLRPRPYAVKVLPGDAAYYNLVAPIPARGHIFHWLYDYTLPLLTWLEHREAGTPLKLLVNAESVPFQSQTLAFLQSHYQLAGLEPAGRADALKVERLETTVFVPHFPRALQARAGLAMLGRLGAYLGKQAESWISPRRIYISRNDARLRRVANETELLPMLAAAGFQRVILKGMEPAKQVKLFREAEAIIAPHGAGLAHISWSRPGTKVFEIFPDPGGPLGPAKNATDNFWLISTLCGLDYEAAFGGPKLNGLDAFNISKDVLADYLRRHGLA